MLALISSYSLDSSDEVSSELSELADDESVAIAAAEHPERNDVRMVGVVLRTGAAVNALRFKSHDDDASVAIAADLVPQLNDAVRATFD